VVGGPEQPILKVNELAWDMDLDDLPSAVAEDLLPEGEAAKEERTVGGPLPFANHVSVLGEALDDIRQGQKRVAIPIRQVGMSRPSISQRGQGVDFGRLLSRTAPNLELLRNLREIPRP